jgi:acetolactate synthase-1/2/3 large subunit
VALVLLSGHAATWELGRGGFQELRQADMAAPVTKASWTASSAATLGRDIGEAMRVAVTGRPGPVHVSLPSDLLDEPVESNAIVWPKKKSVVGRQVLTEAAADIVLKAIADAQRPLILAGPHLSSTHGRGLLARLETVTNVPAVVLESPRGLADASLGAFHAITKRADLVVLLGKALDFTTKWTSPPAFAADLRLIVIDPEAALVERGVKEAGDRLLLGCIADVTIAAEMLIVRASVTRNDSWLSDANMARDGRPTAWASIVSQTKGRLHPAEVFRVLRPYVERDPDTVLICDGGEFAQWAQSMLPIRRRLINGVAGSIGCSLSFALSARLVEANAPVFAVLGDGALGFHIAEFETALRRKLPFVAIVGNDARWNAESQIQLREYGRDRMHGCELLPARYDQVVTALGGHGELVENAADLPRAIDRSLASGKPACINIMIESAPAPLLAEEASSIRY